ncbi:methyltransferase domain-containing protein [Methanoplanus sp. FWC-SCC4]|uniref:Methyltransferase domain-containing protein n=1 Tax=Methanochimaera problematica TaxID=2609417 RepID=A0AA97I4A8_9EURY|nr:methyltransferase domain-containing protein [Methanoplanus sp. FWC-SCC4]
MTKVATHYDQVAAVYDSQYDQKQGKIYYGHICSKVMENLPKRGKLLDLGCGTGLFMHRYVSSGGEAFGLDISRGMIIKAHGRDGSDVFSGNAEVLPFCDGVFDCISSILAFSYLQNPNSMLDESYRLLKPGGALSVCTLGHNMFTKMVPVAYRIGEKLKIKRVGVGTFKEHYYREDEIRELFEKAGFEDVKVERISFAHVDLKPSLYSIAKKVEPFVEEKVPYLAFNLCVSGKKPEK